MNSHFLCCLFGMAGNVSVEIVKLLQAAQQNRYHGKYKDWRFWLPRSLLVLFAGVMALAYSLSGFSYPLLAFHVGVAATLVIEHMASKLPIIDD